MVLINHFHSVSDTHVVADRRRRAKDPKDVIQQQPHEHDARDAETLEAHQLQDVRGDSAGWECSMKVR